MAKEIKIPQIAEGVDSATVTEIMVSEGDSIDKDQSLIAVESDKASVEIPSPEKGTVKSIKISEGDEVKVGDVILTLESASDDDEGDKEKDDSEEEESKDSKKKAKKEKAEDEEKKSSKDDEKDSEEDQDSKESEEEDDKKEKSSESEKSTKRKSEKSDDSEDDEAQDEDEKKKNTEDSKPKESESKETNHASPGVRRLAREIGVDIDEIEASGDDNRITEEDVKRFAKSGNSGSSNSKSKDDKWGETETKKLEGIRLATAKNTANSWSEIPHVFQFDEADISSIEEYIEKIKSKNDKASKITITSVLIKLCAAALRQFPQFNASLDMQNEQMILKKYINIGVAVDTEKGLLVPVIRNVDRKSIIEISEELVALAEKARNGKLSPDEMKGGNFTISNLGGFGGTNFTPIVVKPQVAILGVSRAKTQPVFINGNFEPREILPLSLSYDHRIIDGADGVKFINWIAKALENPYQAILGV